LKRKREELAIEKHNTILAEWQKKLDLIPENEKKAGNWYMKILPHTDAHYSNLQCMHYVDLGRYDNKTWSWECYTSCVSNSKPLTLRANSVKSLLPDREEDLLFLLNEGMQLKVYEPTERTVDSLAELKDLFRQFGEDFKRLSAKEAVFEHPKAYRYRADLREVKKHEEGRKTSKDQEWNDEYDSLVKETISEGLEYVRSFYDLGTHEDPRTTKIREKLKKIKEILES
jgi:hypothetical protein